MPHFHDTSVVFSSHFVPLITIRTRRPRKGALCMQTSWKSLRLCHRLRVSNQLHNNWKNVNKETKQNLNLTENRNTISHAILLLRPRTGKTSKSCQTKCEQKHFILTTFISRNENEMWDEANVFPPSCDNRSDE